MDNCKVTTQASCCTNRPQRPAPPCMGENSRCCNNQPPLRPPVGPPPPPQQPWPPRPGRPPMGPPPPPPQRPPMEAVPLPAWHPWSQSGPRMRAYDMQNFDPDAFPIGMGYVPIQAWSQTYPVAQGFERGTIFPELDLPFMIGRCVR